MKNKKYMKGKTSKMYNNGTKGASKKYSSGKKYFAGLGSLLGAAGGAGAAAGAAGGAAGGAGQIAGALGKAGGGGMGFSPSKYLGVAGQVAGMISSTTGDEKAAKVAGVLNNVGSVSGTMEQQIKEKGKMAASVATGLPIAQKGMHYTDKPKNSKGGKKKYSYMRKKM